MPQWAPKICGRGDLPVKMTQNTGSRPHWPQCFCFRAGRLAPACLRAWRFNFHQDAVVCLPGLTRTTADYDDLARVLAAGKPARRVIALDSRGRGQSAYDSNPKNYAPAVELRDLLEVLNALNIARAVFVGSSRGGRAARYRP